MLKEAHEAGARAALAHLKLSGFVGDTARGLVGSPGRAFVEGGRAFAPGGFLSTKNVFWPAVSGPGGSKLNWINRASTVMGAAGVAQGLMGRDDGTGDGRLSRVLGGTGRLLGSMYGFPMLGALGAPMLGAAGDRVGRGIGHLLGSRG